MILLSKFKKEKNPVAVIEEQTATVEKPTTFEEIQGGIVSEIDRTLSKYQELDIRNQKVQELKNKIESYKKDNQIIYEKIESLESVGLINTPTSNLLSKLDDDEYEIKLKIKEAEAEIERITTIDSLTKEYSLKYPTFKFIDTETFTKILLKYDLVLGEAEHYSKEIPDKVLLNILKFKDQINEGSKTLFLVETRYGSRGNHNWYEVKTHIPPNDDLYIYRSVYSHKQTNLVFAAPEDHFSCNTRLGVPKYTNKGNQTSVTVSPMYVNPNTRVFEINLNFFQDLAEHNNKIIRKLEDPMACLRVPGGFIIIDAWDKEANIPEINRENLN